MRQIALVIAGLLVALAGCDSGSSSSTSSGNKGQGGSPRVTVLASVYPMADMAQRLGGGWVDAQWVIEAGRRPEDVDAADPELRRRANQAVAIVTAGPWDTWALTDLSLSARATRLVEPDHMPAAHDADPRGYLWLDPPVVRDMVDALRVRLTVYDPKRDRDLRAGAKAYLDEVDAVDHEFATALAPFKGRKVLLARPVWGPMLFRYGLEPVAPVSTYEERLTKDDFKAIVPAAKASGLKTILVDEATPAGVRQQIEDRTGLKVLTLDAVGTSATEGRNTWARVMRYNLAQLLKSLNP